MSSPSEQLFVYNNIGAQIAPDALQAAWERHKIKLPPHKMVELLLRRLPKSLQKKACIKMECGEYTGMMEIELTIPEESKPKAFEAKFVINHPISCDTPHLGIEIITNNLEKAPGVGISLLKGILEIARLDGAEKASYGASYQDGPLTWTALGGSVDYGQWRHVMPILDTRLQAYYLMLKESDAGRKFLKAFDDLKQCDESTWLQASSPDEPPSWPPRSRLHTLIDMARKIPAPLFDFSDDKPRMVKDEDGNPTESSLAKGLFANYVFFSTKPTQFIKRNLMYDGYFDVTKPEDFHGLTTVEKLIGTPFKTLEAEYDRAKSWKDESWSYQPYPPYTSLFVNVAQPHQPSEVERRPGE